MHLAHSTFRHQNVSSCQISVDKVLPSKVLHSICHMLAEAETELGELMVLWMSRSEGEGGNGGTDKGRKAGT